jgi:Flp pilus assembly protein TadG
MSQSIRRRRRGGQSMLEFALIAPVFMMLMVGILDFGRVGLFYVSSSALAGIGARYGAAWNTGTPFTDCQIVTYVKGQADATMMANLSEPGGCTTPASPGNTTPPKPLTSSYEPPVGSTYIFIDRSSATYITVSIVYAFRPTTPMLSSITGTIYTVGTAAVYTEY